MKNEIIPVILAKDSADFKNKLNIIKTLRPKLKMIQVDVADGKFTPFKTFHDYKKIKKIGLPPFEAHLMVTDPLRHTKDCLKAGAKRVLFHLETQVKKKNQQIQPSEKIVQILKYIKSNNKEAGLCLNPNTPLSTLSPYLNLINCILLLGVNPGRSGQSFQPQILKKIIALRRLCPTLPIEVDGGVKLDNARTMFKAGANRLSVASAVINAENPQKAYQQLLKISK